MGFDKRDSFQEEFKGFVQLRSLDVATVPSVAGVYLVVRESRASPEFLKENPGGKIQVERSDGSTRGTDGRMG